MSLAQVCQHRQIRRDDGKCTRRLLVLEAAAKELVLMHRSITSSTAASYAMPNYQPSAGKSFVSQSKSELVKSSVINPKSDSREYTNRFVHKVLHCDGRTPTTSTESSLSAGTVIVDPARMLQASTFLTSSFYLSTSKLSATERICINSAAQTLRLHANLTTHHKHERSWIGAISMQYVVGVGVTYWDALESGIIPSRIQNMTLVAAGRRDAET